MSTKDKPKVSKTRSDIVLSHNSPLERRNSLLYHRFPLTDRLNPHLWCLLQRPNLAYMGIRRITRTKLANARRGEAALGVVGVLARAGLEDGRFAGRHCHGGRIEDEAEAGNDG